MQVRDFTLRQLATFVQAARAGSFAKAADQLGISQPAVSDHIATLERRIGRPLFIRRRGASSQLTEAGTELLRKAEML
ncbi:MAG: LysR family transcriptional regulator, partial [Sphingomonadales bacterium]